MGKNTLPEGVKIHLIGIEEQLEASLHDMLKAFLLYNGDFLNLAGLDGLTFAADYRQALLNLNRGYDTKFVLTPTEDYGVGIAMSPSVLREGVLKSHIVINAQAFLGALLENRKALAINMVAHECAHVELNHLYEAKFPGILLRRKVDIIDQLRIESVLTCWGEFGACWRSALIGPTELCEYELPFLEALANARSNANLAIREYRTHAKIERVINEACGFYHGLMKYSAYHLGNLHGHDHDWRNVQTTADSLKGHWFLPFFERLEAACKALAANYGAWLDSQPFDVLGDVAQDLVAAGGLRFERHEDGRVSLDIPLTADTIPI